MLLADPNKYIFLVAFTGGPYLTQHSTYSDRYKHVQTWLNKVEFENKGKIAIHPVIAKKPTPQAFGDSSGYILEGASPNFMKWILDQQVHSLVAAGASLFAYPINPDNCSWVVLTLQAGANCQIIDDEDFKHATLGSVLKMIYENKGMLNWAKKFLQARPHDPLYTNVSPVQLLVQLTRAYQITDLESRKPKKEVEPRLQIHGRPVSDKLAELSDFTHIVRNLSFHVSFKKLEVDKRVIRCLWCKQSIHTHFKCLYAVSE
ncbi:hypothetical protein E1B28_003018 [Marasmius oreades]|uniref:Uncharacterized protein n=1 Tax=Marasmius oreades TaxID=181124 RepID=A0A9P7UJ23_9AGAR|nr:uncharacterized protein E1B28_003018 [Marasmius oreades]KAG7085457.1 hypothetical protein E1B28_003018 [Marasmius oreades]